MFSENTARVADGIPTGPVARVKPVMAFACRIANRPEWGESIYNATSLGQAKMEHYLKVSEPWPEIKYTDIRGRKVGSAHTSAAFRRTAEYRGLPELRCGQEVRVGESDGVVVGHNSSANFNVLFHSGPYAGQRLSVHPSELVAHASPR